MSEDPKKKKSSVDKLVMGVIIGGAIGSVLGVTLAPKKGKETRKFIKNKGGEMIERGKEFLDEHHDQIDDLKSKAKKKAYKIWALIKEKAASKDDEE